MAQLGNSESRVGGSPVPMIVVIPQNIGKAGFDLRGCGQPDSITRLAAKSTAWGGLNLDELVAVDR